MICVQATKKGVGRTIPLITKSYKRGEGVTTRLPVYYYKQERTFFHSIGTQMQTYKAKSRRHWWDLHGWVAAVNLPGRTLIRRARCTT